MSEELRAVADVPGRRPLHPSITRAQISDLVDTFYTRVRAHHRLGAIFEQRIDGDWPPHLAKMKLFWASVLLRTGEYKGKPVPVHARLSGVVTDDYRAWLGLFRTTVREVFAPDAQPLVIDAAERIASSLWLATSGNLLAKPPDWAE